MSELVSRGQELKELVSIGREGTTVILDEVSSESLDSIQRGADPKPLLQFYSWYIYPEHDKDYGKSVSSAEYVEDVNEASVLPGPSQLFLSHENRTPSSSSTA